MPPRRLARHESYGNPITAISGKGLNKTTKDLLFLHSSFVHEEDGEDQDNVVEIKLDSFQALRPPKPPKKQDDSGDRTRPWFLIRSGDDDERGEVRRLQVPPPQLRIPRRESHELFVSVPSTPNDQGSGGSGGGAEEKGEEYPEWEREWRLYERKERAARDARVAVSGRCFQPTPMPITQYSGPMGVILLDRLAALTNLRREEDEGDGKGEEGEEESTEEDVVQPLSEYEHWVWGTQQSPLMEAEVGAQTRQQQEHEEVDLEEEEATEYQFHRVATGEYTAFRGHERSLTTPPDTPEPPENQRIRRLSDELFLASHLGSSRTWA
ncbi:hypothetical protein PG995_000587 [Apiospora arundinis]|uniref:Uncharacterized protein n=1 Tax=Apiospora arundinis TaxID=335852 RepID=A0ABR2JAC3_9PEZI